MKVAVEHIFEGPTQINTIYDSTKTLVSKLIKQYNGVTEADKYIGPPRTIAFSQVELSGVAAQPVVYQWSPTLYWVFMADASTAALTRRIFYFIFDSENESLTYQGFITMNFSAITGNKTLRAMHCFVSKHITGTVAVSGTTVTGSSTLFTSDRIAAGARIGFGSTDPNNITTWYEISSIASNTALTLTADAGIIAGGTAYVIEEIRIATPASNATATNGGLYLIKGLNPSCFQPGGFNIAEAASTDNLRAIYWLKDATTVTMTIPSGADFDVTGMSPTNLDYYVINSDAATTPRIFKFNLRAALTVASGVSTNAFVLKTGTVSVTGNVASLFNGEICALSHAPVSGVMSFYFVTTSRVYRVALSGITNGSTSWVSDFMVENPPGGTTVYAANSTLNSIDYCAEADRIFVSSISPSRTYFSKYYTDGSQFDYCFGVSSSTIEQIASPSDLYFSMGLIGGLFMANKSGYLIASVNSTTIGQNSLVVFPFGADWETSSAFNSYVITPEILTPNATALFRLFINKAEVLGPDTYGRSTEGYRVWYRVSGISDNSGSWTLLADHKTLTSISPTGSIQFKIEFRVMGDMCVATRIYSLSVVYEDASSDSHYEPSASKSNGVLRQITYRQKLSWSGTVPNLRMRIYNVSTGLLILDDTVSSSTQGVWEYSTNGTTWNAWSSSADAIGNYIRYTATTLPSVEVRALLTQ